MEKHRLQPLSDLERKIAVENHGLVYAYLHTYGYSVENYYPIAVEGFLKGIQVYNRREDLWNRFDLPYIVWQHMKAEIANYHRMQQAKKRIPPEIIISLDSDGCLDVAGTKSTCDEVLENEAVKALLEKLAEHQQTIAEMLATGYSNKEVYLMLEIKPLTYYKELNRIKETLIG